MTQILMACAGCHDEIALDDPGFGAWWNRHGECLRNLYRLTEREREWLCKMPAWSEGVDDNEWVDGRKIMEKFDRIMGLLEGPADTADTMMPHERDNYSGTGEAEETEPARQGDP